MKHTLLFLVCSTLTIGGQTQTTSLNDYSFLSINNEMFENEWGAPIFEDDFSSFNSNYWTSVRNNWNIYFSYYSLDNVEIENSSLILKAIKENKYVPDHQKHYNMTIGEVWTKGNLGGAINNNNGKFHYGYFEICAKLARGKGMHSSFWLFGDSSGEKHEIDVFEASHWGMLPDKRRKPDKGNPGTGNQHTTHFGTNLHRDIRDGMHVDHPHHFGISNTNTGSLSEDFNIYAVEWTPHEITWYFNNREIRRVKSDEFLEVFNISDFHPMRLILSLDYNNRLDQESPDSSKMEVKYVRVYQKDYYKEKPKILGSSIVCGNPSYIKYYAENYKKGDIFKWQVIDGNGYILNGIDNMQNVSVRFTKNKRTMTLKLTITDTEGNSSSRTKVITNRRDPYFFINQHMCSNSTNKTSLELIANNSNPGSEWYIYKCDVDGNIISDRIEVGWGESTYTFNNLEGNTYYKIYHGVWENNCSNWSQASRVYKTSLLRSFNIKNIIKYPYHYRFSALAHDNEQETSHCWAIYNSDANGSMGSQIGNSQWSDSVSFDGLEYGDYYIIKHGVWNNCNSWKESRRLIYIPSRSTEFLTKNIDTNLEQVNNSIYVNIFPNPASDIVLIVSNKKMENLYLFSLSGKLIKKYKPNSMETKIECSDIQNGEYILLIINKNYSKSEKIIIAK